MDNGVQDRTARRFIAAVRTLEQDGDLEPMVMLFADHAELSKLDGRGVRHGRGGAREFWTEYRDAFSEITTTFTHATEGSVAVALEWTAQGTLAGGRAVDYAGATVIDLDGDWITGCRTYYDSAAFLGEQATAAPSAGQRDVEGAEVSHTSADSGFEPLADREAASGDARG